MHLLCLSNITFKYYCSRSVTPVKLAYASYESMKGNKDNPKEPIMIMHGLFGSKNNWSTLSKAIHQQTDRKVDTWTSCKMRSTWNYFIGNNYRCKEPWRFSALDRHDL